MNEQHIFIVRCGEVALKGMNKPYFERMLAERIRKLLKRTFADFEVKRQESLPSARRWKRSPRWTPSAKRQSLI